MNDRAFADRSERHLLSIDGGLSRNAVGEGGATNSRPADKNVSVGIDTLRLRWRADSRNHDRLRRGRQHQTGSRGEVWCQHDGRYRVGSYPDGHVYVEARAAVLVDRDRESHRLVAAHELGSASALVAGELEDELGLYLDADPAVARADPCGDLIFDDGQEGRHLLRAVAALDVPWAKVGTEGQKGGDVETVHLRHVRGKSILARWYDAGLKHGTHAPGERIRFESQNRFRKAREGYVTQFDAGHLARLHVKHLRWWAEHDDVAFGGPSAVLRRCTEAVAEGTLAPHVADRIVGFAAMVERVGLAELKGKRNSAQERWWYRSCARLREYGYAIDTSPVPVDNVVPLGRHVRALADAWAV